jgi:dephospho-CoA kinase
MLRVGLTGSIAVGKSFVTEVLAELGCHVVDADVTAREAVLPGSPGLAALVAEFGTDVLRDDGTLDRQHLADVVFADAEKRSRLNAILHPFIIARQDELLNEWEAIDPQGIGVVDAALMIESGGYRRFDKLIVVHCRPEIQIARLMARNGLSQAEAETRIGAQLSQEEKLQYADFKIDTSAGFEDTRQQTAAVYRQLKELN